MSGWPHVRVEDAPAYWGRVQFREYLSNLSDRDPSYWKYKIGAKWAPFYDSEKPIFGAVNLFHFLWPAVIGAIFGAFTFVTFGLSLILWLAWCAYQLYCFDRAMKTIQDPTVESITADG
jgi:hypothetical protein